MLLPNMDEELTTYLPLKNNCFGISYAVEGSLENKDRKFSVRAYDVSKEAKRVKFTTNDELDAKVYQILEKNGIEEEEEIKGRLEVYDEARIDREKRLDKALKVAKIGYYTSKGISSIITSILGAIGLHFHINSTSADV